MKAKEGRDIVINRVRKELIGPGSDIFLCNSDYTDEIIEGKPLQMVFFGNPISKTNTIESRRQWLR